MADLGALEREASELRAELGDSQAELSELKGASVAAAAAFERLQQENSGWLLRRKEG